MSNFLVRITVTVTVYSFILTSGNGPAGVNIFREGTDTFPQTIFKIK